MRLATLNPSLTWSHLAPDGCYELTFDCPKCGPSARVYVRCRLNGPVSPGVWAMTLPPSPSGDGWDGFTLSPSIQNNNHGRAPCGYHCSIINGDVIP